MSGKNTAVFGIYKSRAQVERAIDVMTASGFSNNDVSVLVPDAKSTKEFAHKKGSKAPEGATTGATTGAVVGGTIGLLMSAGMLIVPGVGPLIVAGPIVAGLAGVGAGGAVGGLIGTLVGLGIPEYEAKRYEGRVKDGGILLSVHCDTSEEISNAKDLLRDTGAEDISSAGEQAAASSSSSYDDETWSKR